MGKIVKYKMEMEVLTPVHIAGADYKSKLNKTEYIFNPNTNDLTIIDNNKFIDFLIKKKIVDKYMDEIKDNNRLNLFYFLKNNDLYKNKDRNKILYEDLRDFTKKSYKNLDLELKIKENVINALLEKVYVDEYNLRTRYFFLENIRIRGFIGNIKIRIKSKDEMLWQLLNFLLQVSEYTGLGVKTALGMGGIKI